MLFEVLGNLLQLTLVLFLLLGAFLLGRNLRPPLRAFLAYSLLLPCFFLHEASVFLLAPCIPFLLRSIPRPRDLLPPAAAITLLAGLSLVFSDLHPHLSYDLVLVPHTATLAFPVQTLPFKELLRQIYLVKFGGLHGALLLLFKCFRLLTLAVAALVAMANLLPSTLFRRPLYLLATVIVFSIPLWIIGEDWGRFLAYSLLLATVLTAWQLRFPLALPVDPRAAPLTDPLATVLLAAAQLPLVRLAALAVLLFSPFHESRVLGITTHSLALCAILLVAALAQALGWNRHPLASYAEAPRS